MRVVMLGYQTPGHRTLQALLDSEHEVVQVVTHPRSDHAYEKIWDDSVADLAEEHGVPVLVRQRPDTVDLPRRLKEVEPDILVATNWRTWIPPEVYSVPRLGGLNVHDSLLPSYAGFAPLLWALINDEKQVGITAHVMDEAIDGGDIVLQRAVPVGATDTATDLFHKTIGLYGPITLEAVDRLADGTAQLTPQDATRGSFFHKRSEEDSRIDWTWPARDIVNLVRAQSDPYPNAFTHHRGQRLRIMSASVSEQNYGGTPGRIFIPEGDGVVVVAGADARHGRNRGLVVNQVRTDDGTDLPAREYFTSMGGYLTPHP